MGESTVKTALPIKVGLVGDCSMNIHMLSLLINSNKTFDLLFANMNLRSIGKDLHLLSRDNLPDIILLDFNHEAIVVVEIIDFIKKRYPMTKIASIGFTTEFAAIAILLLRGINCHISKRADATDLFYFLKELHKTGAFITQIMQEVIESRFGFGDVSAELDLIEDAAGLTDLQRRYLRLSIKDISNENVKRRLRIPTQQHAEIVKQTYRKFKVHSRPALILEIYRKLQAMK